LGHHGLAKVRAADHIEFARDSDDGPRPFTM
jgi:hypothetical protein